MGSDCGVAHEEYEPGVLVAGGQARDSVGHFDDRMRQRWNMRGSPRRRSAAKMERELFLYWAAVPEKVCGFGAPYVSAGRHDRWTRGVGEEHCRTVACRAMRVRVRG